MTFSGRGRERRHETEFISVPCAGAPLWLLRGGVSAIPPAGSAELGSGTPGGGQDALDRAGRDGASGGDGRVLDVNIYEKRGDSRPVQHFEDAYYCSNEAVDLTVEDVNFDGNLDFHFIVAVGEGSNRFSSYYIWYAEHQAFQQDPYGLNNLCSAQLYPEERVIRTFMRYNIGAHETCFYRFENGGLVCVRRLKIDYPGSPWRTDGRAWRRRWRIAGTASCPRSTGRRWIRQSSRRAGRSPPAFPAGTNWMPAASERNRKGTMICE